MKNRKLKTIILLLLISILLLSALSYGLWKKREQSAVNDYKMYMAKQYDILNFLQDSLDVRNNTSDFTNKLMLAKGEFTYLDPIIKHVPMP